jgi:hypothetical protein
MKNISITIQNYISSLRLKSVETRKQLLVISTFSLTAIIVIVWITTFSSRLNNLSKVDDSSDASSPFAIVQDSVVSIYATAIEGLNN